MEKLSRINKVLILFLICVLVYSCANNKLTQQTVTKGSYTLLGKREVESASIIGFVKDKKTGNILSSANVSIDCNNVIGVVTDEKGYFALEVVPGNIQIKVSSVGNNDLKTRTIKIKPKEQIQINFYLGTFEIR
ncbi:carboxypeptidase-like regulatory domain-containing protein [Flavobacterium orientale]|uniref:CarboxypepD_reg-like domain-containing protein n=1 Tax=Flavobacterium orientale TaxID=1756020 RepID=A0A916XZ64_9FLAO|nr:carboxypeptidase-like regulatory domain-containing protein [Flavobacterium orientale]GGD21260.1 hypothetical protein GCM10011343_09650 [Flavobacterium orientale]